MRSLGESLVSWDTSLIILYIYFLLKENLINSLNANMKSRRSVIVTKVTDLKILTYDSLTIAN